MAKTFKATFPNAEIIKVDVDAEDGIAVYDLEFKDGAAEKETDITADFTILSRDVQRVDIFDFVGINLVRVFAQQFFAVLGNQSFILFAHHSAFDLSFHIS